jgi:hypothetical protein
MDQGRGYDGIKRTLKFEGARRPRWLISSDRNPGPKKVTSGHDTVN